MELFHAHNQWKTRPADERFPSLQALHDATKQYAASAMEASDVPYSALRVEADGDNIVLIGKRNAPANLTNWAFGQLSSRAEAPAGFLRQLPATLAAQVLNNRMKTLYPAQSAFSDSEGQANLLFHKNGGLLCRAMTSNKYSRIWNYEVAERLLEKEAQGWTPAMPTMRKSLGDFPALYASDHDMFAFIMMPNKTIQQPVPGAKDMPPMYKGLIYFNSEVGESSIGAVSFYYNEMCGNHIIWGASGVTELKAKHVGTVRDRVQNWDMDIRRFADASTADDEAAMKAAVNMRIAGTKEELLDALFGKRSLGLSRKAIEASYDAVVEGEDGSPLTKWGFVQGVTRHSQTVKYADQRQVLDRAAGRLMSMEF